MSPYFRTLIGYAFVGLCAATKVDHIYSGELSGPTVDAMRECNAAGPLMINIVKLFPTPDGQNFLAFGRVFSGTVRAGDTVRVLGENYTTSDEEDLAVRSISSISISQVCSTACVVSTYCDIMLLLYFMYIFSFPAGMHRS